VTRQAGKAISVTAKGAPAAIRNIKDSAKAKREHFINKGKGNDGICFIAGTLIYTEDGLTSIEDICVGDKVYSIDIETGEKGLKRVVQTFVNETYELVTITVNGKEIITTPNHPFYVVDKGWMTADELNVGDELTLISGVSAMVNAIRVEQLSVPVKVYNFEVENWHTYFVGTDGVLVHNECRNLNVKSGSSRAPTTSTPNSIYEQIGADGTVSSRTFYDSNGNSYLRQDFSHPHFDKGTQQYLQPHEHGTTFNQNGQPIGHTVQPLLPGSSNVPSS